MGLRSTDRLEIFSDGVIAIAITLLVLDVKVPAAKDGQLIHALLARWPSYVAYVLSFAVIGIIWVSHHSMFERIAQVDRGLLFTNLGLLLGVAFVPFPTALLAEYARQGGSNAHTAAAVYSGTMTVIGLAFLAIWLHLARRPELLAEDSNPANLRRSIRRSLVSPVAYAATIGLAFVSALACLGIYALIASYLAFGPSSRALLASHGIAEPPTGGIAPAAPAAPAWPTRLRSPSRLSPRPPPPAAPPAG